MSNLTFSWIQGDDRAVMAAPGLDVIFTRAGPCWAHHLELLHQGKLEVAATVEYDPERDHPARIVSPVYQELQFHALSDTEGLCALLTGHLHQHHFSAAIRLFADPEQLDTLVLDIDVADRCRARVENLAATYTVHLTSSALADASPEKIVWNLEGPIEGQLELAAHPPATLALVEAGRAATRVQAVAAIERETLTHRLRYGWRWTSAPSLT